MKANSEIRALVHSFGDTQINHWWEAEAIDNGVINSPNFEIVTPMQAGLRDLVAKGYTRRTWSYFQCTSCQLMCNDEPLIQGGDESISVCPSCGCMETFETKAMDLWDKPKAKRESQSRSGTGGGSVHRGRLSVPETQGDQS